MSEVFEHEGFISKITTLADGTIRMYFDLQEFDDSSRIALLHQLHKMPCVITIDATQPFTEVEKILANKN